MKLAIRNKRPGPARGRGRRAVAAVEMAVVTPLLLAVLFGIIEFGWLFTVQHTLVNAAREGARTGILEGADATDVTTVVLNYLAPMGLDDLATVNVTEATPDDPTVTVDLSVPRAEVSLVGSFFGFTSGELEACCAMRKEGL
jgi:Flp pilus assembly protein TadG